MESFMIEDTRAKLRQVLKQHENICVSISGGADSDCLVELFEQERQPQHNITYLFMDTGLEFQATKNHLNYLESKYNIQITRYRGKWNIPRVAKKYGQPLFNKENSRFIEDLQRYNFDFNVTNTFEEDFKQTPIKGAMNWWHQVYKNGFKVSEKRKQYLNKYPLDFQVTNKCCQKVKKDIAHKFLKDNKEITLTVIGIRKSEGGVRKFSTKDCYDIKNGKYYPILNWNDDVRDYFTKEYNVKHSDCYEVWGLKRTGCAGCPFGRYYKEELETIKQYEPNMYKACNKVFGDSYRYLEHYDEFKKTKREK